MYLYFGLAINESWDIYHWLLVMGLPWQPLSIVYEILNKATSAKQLCLAESSLMHFMESWINGTGESGSPIPSKSNLLVLAGASTLCWGGHVQNILKKMENALRRNTFSVQEDSLKWLIYVDLLSSKGKSAISQFFLTLICGHMGSKQSNTFVKESYLKLLHPWP